jgi:hypothetical protein
MRYQTLSLLLFTVLIILNSSCKKKQYAKVVTIHYSGSPTIDSFINFSTEPTLMNAVWNFGDNTISEKGVGPSHRFLYGSRFTVSVSSSNNGQDYTGTTTIYIPTKDVYFTKKYASQLRQFRNWHHHAFIHLYNTPVKDDTHFTHNDTSFAFTMRNDSSIAGYTVIKKATDSTVYFTDQISGPQAPDGSHDITLTYNVITNQVIFTTTVGSSGNTGTSIFTSY